MNWKEDKDNNNARTYFRMAMDVARNFNLQWEFVHFYKQRRREGSGILDSIHYSCAEWDLYQQ